MRAALVGVAKISPRRMIAARKKKMDELAVDHDR